MIKLIDFSPQVAQLLSDCALKSDDVTPETHLLGSWDNEQLVGVVGLDVCEGLGLLRSLAVQPAARGQGLAVSLVREVELLAQSLGVSQVYLLTNTAANFFARQGYQVVKRTDAPLPIQSTAQFSSLCPDSAVLMFKNDFE
jgi:amino-acid N-acetyltransferase